MKWSMDPNLLDTILLSSVLLVPLINTKENLLFKVRKIF